MTLTNAERQRRFRERRNALAAALVGEPDEIAKSVIARLGPDVAREVVRSLQQRLRARSTRRERK